VIRDKPLELGYKRLVAWQLTDRLAWEVYSATDSFPKVELFGLTSQLNRAILSVVLNIVEGYARNSKNEFRRFLLISLGSLAESGYLLDFAFKRSYLSKDKYQKLIELKNECGRVLWKLMKSQ